MTISSMAFMTAMQDALETYEIASPKESNAHWMRAIKEVVVEKKQKLGLRYGESTHTAAIEIAKARQAIRPNRTQRGLAAALPLEKSKISGFAAALVWRKVFFAEHTSPHRGSMASRLSVKEFGHSTPGVWHRAAMRTCSPRRDLLQFSLGWWLLPRMAHSFR
jgi:hypothetical protein